MRVREQCVRHLRGACFVLAFAFASIAAVAQAGSAKAPAPSGLFRIAGTIVNPLTGAPVQGAEVSVLSVEDSHTIASVASDGEGRFVLEQLGAAKYQLTASKRGYRTAFYDEHEGYNTAIVTGPDQDTEHLIFHLSPSAVLHGMVTDDGGDPVEEARVMLFKQPPHRGPEEQITLAESGLTDDTGAYEFSDLAPGQYVVAVETQPWYALHQSSDKPTDENSAVLDVAYPITYFDSTTEEDAASPINLTPGSREDANITLHAVPALHISVEAVHRANGSIVQPELRQFIFGLDVGAESAGLVDPLKTGKVEFDGVAPGHYELSEGDPPRVVDLDATASEQVDPNAGAAELSLTGTLRMTTGTVPPAGTRLLLTPQNDLHGPPQPTTMTHGGRFSFPAIAPGTWTLSGESDRNSLPVVSIGIGTETHPGNTLTVLDRSLDIVAIMGKGITRIEGFAHKGDKGFAGALVILVPQEKALLNVVARRDQSDSDGSFALQQVVPGKYTIVAIEDGWDLDWSSPEVIARYLPGGTAVTVTDNSGEVVHLAGPVAVQPR